MRVLGTTNIVNTYSREKTNAMTSFLNSIIIEFMCIANVSNENDNILYSSQYSIIPNTSILNTNILIRHVCKTYIFKNTLAFLDLNS